MTVEIQKHVATCWPTICRGGTKMGLVGVSKSLRLQFRVHSGGY